MTHMVRPAEAGLALYDGWHATELTTVTSQGNGKEGYDPSRIEVLWSNVPLRAATDELDWGAA